VLGFELAVAMALFVAVMGLDLGARSHASCSGRPLRGRARRVRRPDPGPLDADRRARAGRDRLVPAVISAVRGIWLPTCDWWFGIEAYLAMPLATALLAGAVGHASAC